MNISTKLVSHSEAETRDFAKKFAKELRGGEVLALHGDLGAGKTTFVKGLAAALGIKETITSPTFVLMKVFDIPKPKLRIITARRDPARGTSYGLRNLVHIDAYRLKDASELEDIGALDYLGRKDVVTVIEWPERVGELLKKFKSIIEISFEYGTDSNERIITTTRR